MRNWIGMGLLAMLTGIPAAARADRALVGQFVAQPVEGVVESYRFHRDHTYEWMQEFEGRRHWACGRYRMDGRMMVLLEDPKAESCRSGQSEASGPFVEHWRLADALGRNALELGGERFSRSAPA